MAVPPLPLSAGGSLGIVRPSPSTWKAESLFWLGTGKRGNEGHCEELETGPDTTVKIKARSCVKETKIRFAEMVMTQSFITS